MQRTSSMEGPFRHYCDAALPRMCQCVLRHGWATNMLQSSNGSRYPGQMGHIHKCRGGGWDGLVDFQKLKGGRNAPPPMVNTQNHNTTLRTSLYRKGSYYVYIIYTPRRSHVLRRPRVLIMAADQNRPAEEIGNTLCNHGKHNLTDIRWRTHLSNICRWMYYTSNTQLTIYSETQARPLTPPKGPHMNIQQM